MASRSGFSLIELLIVLTLLGVLASYALPAWNASITKARRDDAMLALGRLAAMQEQFRLKHKRYADNTERAAAVPNGLGMPATPQNYYVLNTVITPTGFAATATVRAAGLQTKDTQCWVFGLDAQGRRSAANNLGADTTQNCWKS